ncbi:MAG: hypothetical protein LBK41_06505 [Clostridiales bacterium]|jgi:hypothetical protein|nr:hypothetical protein [Clostridiales bacterium]
MRTNSKRPGSKALAFALALILAFPAPAAVFANYQSPVVDFTLTDYSPGDYRDAGTYQINARFVVPRDSSRAETAALDGAVIHPPAGYDLYWLNATMGESYDESRKTTWAASAGDPAVINRTITPELNFGGIYMYKVVPWHLHEYPNPQYNPVTNPVPTALRRAPMESPELTAEALFLSDIRLTAEGTDAALTVEWDNPTFRGADLFTSYRFYYASGGSNAVLSDISSSFEVSARDPALIRTQTGTLRYTLSDPNISVGTQYAVKVVPMYNGRRVTDATLTVTAGGRQYPLTSTTREYRFDDLNVRPGLTITREGRDFLRLTWNSYLNTMLNVDSVVIYRSDTPDFKNAENIGRIDSPSAKRINFFLTDRLDRTMYYKAVIYYINPGETTPVPLETVIAAYNPAHESFAPTKPTVLASEDSDSPPYSVELTWEAFVRRAYGDYERSLADAAGDIIDKEIVYDIYVSDDLSVMDTANPVFMAAKIVDSLPASALRQSVWAAKPAYSYTVSRYAVRDANGAFQIKDMTDNRVYYFMIIARRTSGETSAPAYWAHWYAPKETIITRPETMARPPLTVKDVSKTSVTIAWEEKWYEVYNPADDKWYSSVAANEGGGAEFGDAAGKDALRLAGSAYNLTSRPEDGYALIRAAMAQAGISAPETYPIRFIDITGSSYELNAAAFDYIMGRGGYDAYRGSLAETDWTGVQPAAVGAGMEYTLTATTSPALEALSPNTAYVAFLRPYRVAPDGTKTAYYPNYAAATTLADRPDITITPTVPVLEPVSAEDTALTVRFPYMSELDYELFHAELMSAYPDGGEGITAADLLKNGEIRQDGGKRYMYFTITGLFPDTLYYVWARASSGEAKSDYSNPVSMRTTPIRPPAPPSGLGLASASHLDVYNKENGTEYKPKDADYLIIEWLRDVSDAGTSDAERTAGWLPSDNIGEFLMARFGDLAANRTYYIRAKTVLTVARDGAVIKSVYNYVVQLSDDPAFADPVEITVPPAAAATGKALTAESDWCQTVRVTTGTSSGEYDGDKNPETYPMPGDDFETLYDAATDTLTARFRADGRGADGLNDNRADQRLVSSLIASGAYTLSADLSSYKGRAVTNAVLDMPWSIIKALSARKIKLEFTHGQTTLTFAPGFAETASALNGLTDVSRVRIAVSGAIGSVPGLETGERYGSDPKRVAVTVGPERAGVLAAPVSVAMKAGSFYNSDGYNAAMYASGGAWAAMPAYYDAASNTLTARTRVLSAFGVIVKPAPRAYGGSDQDLKAVVARMAVTGGPFNLSAPAGANVVNAALSALASGKGSANLSATVPDAELEKLRKAGLYVAAPATRAAAYAAFDRLRGIAAGRKIVSAPPDRPGDALTYAELFRLAREALG